MLFFVAINLLTPDGDLWKITMKKPAQHICCSWHHNPRSLLNQQTKLFQSLLFLLKLFLLHHCHTPALVDFCPFSPTLKKKKKISGRILSSIWINLGDRLAHFLISFCNFVSRSFFGLSGYGNTTASRTRFWHQPSRRSRGGVAFPLLHWSALCYFGRCGSADKLLVGSHYWTHPTTANTQFLLVKTSRFGFF